MTRTPLAGNDLHLGHGYAMTKHLSTPPRCVRGMGACALPFCLATMSLAQDEVLTTDPSVPPAFQDKLLGSLVVGSYVNAILYILEIIQVIYFFNHYRRDRPRIEAGIIISLVMDSLYHKSVCLCVLVLCNKLGDESYVFDQYWPIPTYLLSTGVTTAVVQSFLIYRFWSLTRQWIISGILGLGMLTSAAGVAATAAAQIVYPRYTERYKGRAYVTLWLIASAVCDVCIAVSLAFQLRKMKPTFQEVNGLSTGSLGRSSIREQLL